MALSHSFISANIWITLQLIGMQRMQSCIVGRTRLWISGRSGWPWVKSLSLGSLFCEITHDVWKLTIIKPGHYKGLNKGELSAFSPVPNSLTLLAVCAYLPPKGNVEKKSWWSNLHFQLQLSLYNYCFLVCIKFNIQWFLVISACRVWYTWPYFPNQKKLGLVVVMRSVYLEGQENSRFYSSAVSANHRCVLRDPKEAVQSHG